MPKHRVLPLSPFSGNDAISPTENCIITYWTTSLGLCFLKKKRYSVRAEYQSVVSLFAFRLIHYATKVYKLFNITNFSEKLFPRSIVKCINYFLFTLTGWGNIWTHYLNVGMRGYLCYQFKFNTFVDGSERISLSPQKTALQITVVLFLLLVSPKISQNHFGNSKSFARNSKWL